MTQTPFTPTRAAALEGLSDFLPKTAAMYASQRNYDLGAGRHAGVSTLSPYIRHRMLPEPEVLQAVLGRYSVSSAEKFVQEVLWRTYWKGWLEQRPSVWTQYQAGTAQAWSAVQTQSGLRNAWEGACLGQTGIECFDHWAQELATTGYLHNHARMWFASIWIFTLKLPWELGADFFIRHLLDGDPASNTLGWRWVAGLQTLGKTYLARPDNIAKYTNGRFNPTGLAPFAEALHGMPHPTPKPLDLQGIPVANLPTGLLITEEDLHPTHVSGLIGPDGPVAGLQCTSARSPLAVSDLVTDFVTAAIRDSLDRFSTKTPAPLYTKATQIADWAADHGLKQVVTAYAPVGPTAVALQDLQNELSAHSITLVQMKRPLDVSAWPHATKGFFPFKKKIPEILRTL